MGRKKIPSEIKLLKGTFRKSRENPNEPKPDNSNIIKPEMSRLASEFWDRVAPELIHCRVLTNLDVSALMLMCESHAMYREAMDEIKTTGLVMINGNTETKSPYIMIANKAFEQVTSLMKEFGMTPASRPHIQTVQDKPINEFDCF